MIFSKPKRISLPVVGQKREVERSKPTLVDQLLGEQQTLTAVERFSQLHDKHEVDLQKKHYTSLLPATPPGEGQQYAFEVDLDKCSGCKACVTACHSLNGLDEGETWRSVGLLHGGTAAAPEQRIVTTSCHHCIDPACMKGCPVGAYKKDSVTGIVKHLDDQCIGCQYCIFTCPYDVPQYSKSRGIVRKCDMCADRLSEDEAPACMQACPTEAISIRVVDTSAAIADAQGDAFLPGAPSPAITVPTTSYKSERVMPRNMLPADFYNSRPAHQHMPLVWMLVLTQLSVGAFIAEQILERMGESSGLIAARPYLALIAMTLALVALGASTMHLGRPQYAWRAFIGLRTSWLSREILVFGAFSALAALYAAALWVTEFDWVGSLGLKLAAQAPWLGPAVGIVGVLGVFCSAMLYHVTHRRWWHIARTSFKFFGTSAVLGLSTMLVSHWIIAWAVGEIDLVSLVAFTRSAAVVLMSLVALKVSGEATILFSLRDKRFGDLKRSASLLIGELKKATFVRLACAIVGGFFFPLFFLTTAQVERPGIALFGASATAILLLVGELAERMTFFGAMSAPRMPGGVGQ